MENNINSRKSFSYSEKDIPEPSMQSALRQGCDMLTKLDEKRLDELMSYAPEYSDKNSENIKAMFSQKAKSQKTTKKHRSFKWAIRAAVAAAVAVFLVFSGAAVVSGTGFAETMRSVTGAIREIVFGNSVVVELPAPAEYLYYDDELRASGLIVVRGSSTIENWFAYRTRFTIPQTTATSEEDARTYASFPMMLPRYLPLGSGFGDFVLTWYDETTVYEVGVLIENVLPGRVAHLGLRQIYVGPDAYLWIEQINPYEISAVMIGGIEAIALDLKMGPTVDGEYVMQREILWISDGIFFTLGFTTLYDEWVEHHASDMEMLVAIAGSVG